MGIARRTAVGEIGQREREDEERRAIFAQLWISDDDGKCETVQHYVQDENYTDDSWSEVVVINCIHIACTVKLTQRNAFSPLIQQSRSENITILFKTIFTVVG